MSRLKLAGKSIFCGGVILILLTFASLLARNETVSQILFAPLIILTRAFNPHFGENPAREATPATGLIVIFGLILCVVFYSIISFPALLIINRFKKPAALK